ncbi:NUDIX hydrolase [Chelatococcus sp. SYSU_G07232]|uniref:NUDIX hydrolase n=1 Tax=Chelatococcus albus TaxID=3047466 RepID=A0ABT7AEH1_9HYPH|nr:NUDIX hydrolase [Chelatococcus sp. SYSU_G07232]MDJ1157752.1 NUDIX hydrolase [Chelatococcus sp. SYSU_G07232]
MPDARLYPTRPFLAASVAVFRDGRVLLAARANPPMAGRFSLPGGLVEPGETLREAALRELAEEVGIEAEIIGFADHVEVVERDERGVKFHFVIAAFAARWRAGEPCPSAETGAVVWADPADIGALPTTAGLAAIVAKAQSVLLSA